MQRKKENNRRKYLRISTVIPVEFCFLSPEGTKSGVYLQGFTNNISKGGICLTYNDFEFKHQKELLQNTNLSLNINLPSKKKPIELYGKIAWREILPGKDFSCIKLGIEFDASKKKAVKSIFNFAVLKKVIPIATALVVSLALSATFLFWLNEKKVARENRKLVKQYIEALEGADIYKNVLEMERANINNLIGEKEDLSAKIDILNAEKLELISRFKVASEDEQQLTEDLKEEIGQLSQVVLDLKKQNRLMEIEIKSRESKQESAEKTYLTQQESISALSEEIIGGMYDWIKNRQDLKSGLIVSYEGDKNLKKMSFTYDQSLAAIALLINNDHKQAKKILDFYYNHARRNKPFYNAYYTNGKVSEYVRHAGVYAWLGLAALNYVKDTGERKYLVIADKVAHFLTSMMDAEGGIKGGPTVKWYSTEHNIDSYAFFKLYAEISGISRYGQAADKVKNWISKYSYTDFSVPVNRGKGDATIATDTYTWSITAIDVQDLEAMGMDADEIMDFALKNCKVLTTFNRIDKLVRVEGFDFAKARNIARKGVISCEWTAQMILAFEVLADYYINIDREKSAYYLNLAKYYNNELQKMIISSPSPSGKANPTLPYASASNVSTGHGWRTPKGDRVGSLAATAYYLFAFKGFNPLKAEFLKVSLILD